MKYLIPVALAFNILAFLGVALGAKALWNQLSPDRVIVVRCAVLSATAALLMQGAGFSAVALVWAATSLAWLAMLVRYS